MPVFQIAAGFAAGWLSALLGIGGGVVLVPMMMYFFKVPIQQAVGTSLAVIIPTALVGAWKHYNLNHLDTKLAVILAVGAVIGAYVGALSVNVISPDLLRKVFAVLLFITAVRMFIS
ncbi:MAG TPA: sulfite exporter TauE/SafE family protein [Syntrophomonadaceae bacterium]|nr:sulfite exporter TauE/SafE family protein [Syntrophomonadaceae bacterium]